jgi:uncharacterized protein YkwD
MKGCLLLLLGLVCVLPFTAARAQDKNKFMLTEDEQRVVDLINQERKKENLPPLKVNPVLTQVARAHTANMAMQGKMDHNLDGKSPFDRIKAAGYKYSLAAENLAVGDLPLKDVIQAWMKSKIHRDNILTKDFTETGIGIANGAKDKVYYTQVFADPREETAAANE